MKYVYPKHIAEQKANHDRRMNVTAEDERTYREPEPLTTDQKMELLYLEERLKQEYAHEEDIEKSWKERYYEDKTNNDIK